MENANLRILGTTIILAENYFPYDKRQLVEYEVMVKVIADLKHCLKQKSFSLFAFHPLL
jgi:hypothetical protein